MRRREFMAGVGASTFALPGAARAQQPKQMQMIGVLQDLAENEPVTKPLCRQHSREGPP